MSHVPFLEFLSELEKQIHFTMSLELDECLESCLNTTHNQAAVLVLGNRLRNAAKLTQRIYAKVHFQQPIRSLIKLSANEGP